MKLGIPRTLPSLFSIVPTALTEALGPPTTEGPAQIWRVEAPVEITIGGHSIKLEPLSADRVDVQTTVRAARFITGAVPVRRQTTGDRTALIFRVPCQIRVLGLTIQLSPVP